MSYDVLPEDDHRATATPVNLTPYTMSRVPLKAPPGTPSTPGEWEPLTLDVGPFPLNETATQWWDETDLPWEPYYTSGLSGEMYAESNVAAPLAGSADGAAYVYQDDQDRLTVEAWNLPWSDVGMIEVIIDGVSHYATYLHGNITAGRSYYAVSAPGVAVGDTVTQTLARQADYTFLGTPDLPVTDVAQSATWRDFGCGYVTINPFDAWYNTLPPNTMGYNFTGGAFRLHGDFGLYFGANGRAVDDAAFRASIDGLVVEFIQVPHAAMEEHRPYSNNPGHWISTLHPDDSSFDSYPVVWTLDPGTIPDVNGWTERTYSPGNFDYQVVVDLATAPALVPDSDGFIHLLIRPRKTDGTHQLQVDAPVAYAYVDFNYDTTMTWQYVGTSIEQQPKYADGYPRVHMETPFDTTDDPIPVAWLKLNGVSSGSTGVAWFGYQNPQLGVIPNADLVGGVSWPVLQVFPRLDGGLTMMDGEPNKYVQTSDEGYKWLWMDEFFPRDGGYVEISPGVPDDYWTSPYAQLVFGSDHYLRVLLYDNNVTGASWEDPVNDIVVYLTPYPKYPRPKMWHWGADDDHNGLQYEGYTYEPVLMPEAPSALVKGFVFECQDSIEDYVYAGREQIMGYVEGYGPFFYGSYTQNGTYWSIFDNDFQVIYDHGMNSDALGRHISWMQTGSGWTSQYDHRYSPTSLLLGRDNMTQVEAWRVDRARATSADLGHVLPWVTQAEADAAPSNYPYPWEFHFLLWSPIYPDSFFVQGAHSDDGYSDPVLRMREYNLTTGAVTREMTPFALPDLFGATWTIVSEDGTKLLSPGAGNAWLEYDLDTMVTTSHDKPHHPTQPMGILDDHQIVSGYFSPYEYDVNTDVASSFNLEPYVGKGYNGSFLGTDGRYLWFHKLNYHVDPSHWRDSDGGIWNIGPGLAQFFDEFYRYDTEHPPGPAGPNLLSNPGAESGMTGWTPVGNAAEFVTSSTDWAATGTHSFRLQGYSLDFIRVMSFYSDQGMLSSDFGPAIVVAPDQEYTVSCTMRSNTTGTGFIQVREVSAGGSLTGSAIAYSPVTIDSTPRDVELIFTTTSDTAGVHVEIGIESMAAYGPTIYLYVDDITLHTSDTKIPIDYVFNLEPPTEQSYGKWVEPEYSETPANLYARDESYGFETGVGDWTIASLGGASPSLSSVSDGEEGTHCLRAQCDDGFELYSEWYDFSATPDYYNFSERLKPDPGTTIYADYQWADASGTILGSSAVDRTYTNETVSFTYFSGPWITGWLDTYYMHPFYFPGATKLRLRLKVTTAAVLLIDKAGLYVGFGSGESSAQFRPPSAGSTEFISRYRDVSTSGIAYYYCNWGYPAWFAPASIAKWQLGRLAWGG